ncbi:hypothetical protein [Rhodoligotrophos defluvii]|uniref:hypothetical protein n=1 Tax=Rhodoligotrophos defluvii TaxID=2561934 RepID=UPI0010C9D43F|nr:hypothetical protein [Rhodoligotrophos defluvii]
MKSAASTAFPVSREREKSAALRFLRRVYQAILTSRQRQADREIARMLHLNGDVLTDSAEREIERRFKLGA